MRIVPDSIGSRKVSRHVRETGPKVELSSDFYRFPQNFQFFSIENRPTRDFQKTVSKSRDFWRSASVLQKRILRQRYLEKSTQEQRFLVSSLQILKEKSESG